MFATLANRDVVGQYNISLLSLHLLFSLAFVSHYNYSMLVTNGKLLNLCYSGYLNFCMLLSAVREENQLHFFSH